MSGTIIFEKGQIWHWEDPIYGSKSDRRAIHKNVSLQCYSRYVLIVQNTESIRIKEPIMCIPLTSSVTDDEVKSKKYMKLLIYNKTKNAAISYAALDRMFPVSAKSLTSYQCKIGYQDMIAIERMIHDLIISPEEDEKQYQNYPPQITIEDIEDADINKCKKSDNDLLQDTKPKKSNNARKEIWTPKAKAKYLEEYYSKGSEFVQKKYNLSKRSISNYAYMFKKELGESNTVTNNDVEDDTSKEESPKQEITVLPSTYGLPRAISKICNKLTDLIKIKDMYHKVSAHFNSEENIAENTFYADISASIYFGICKFLGLNVIDGKIQPIALSSDSEHLTTFRFFDVYWNDYLIARMINLDSICKLCKEKYSCYIEKEVLNDIKAYISKKINMSDEGYDMITSYIEKFMG